MKKIQVAFEYLMIFGTVLLFAVPVWIYVVSLQHETSDDLYLSYGKTLAEKITSASDLVYSQGKGAKLKLRVYVPKNVINISIQGHEINLNMSYNGEFTDIFAVSIAPLNGSLPAEEGSYWIKVESMGEYVQIEITS